jgi:hypothetical protein
MNAPGVVIDSNLLLLLVVGLAGEKYIPKHKRLTAYTVEDYGLLVQSLSGIERIIVTPNTLTETSNLLAHISEPDRSHLFNVFREFISNAEEKYYESGEASQRHEFPRLGLTDSALLEAVSDTNPLLTVDLDLYLAALATGGKAMNFNHMRAIV